ncbi:hypothetical protein MHBO_002905 [Bonamia ostreae]|uniref:Uncharacterized protein n=1 Tax=Bonamia ostreae TaxID=126728 RepID=A0ABV2APJ4_9EUKA
MAAVIATTEKSESDPFSSALRLISENAKSLSKQRKKMRKEIAAKIIPLSSISFVVRC